MGSFLTSDGVRLNFIDEGSGPTVVLIAGYCAPATSWALTQDALVAAGYRVIAFDRRSHGDSESPLFGQRMSRHGKDVAELLDAADLHDVRLVGGSMGANVIWAYVDLFGTDRVSGIVTVDQTPKMLNAPDWPYGFYGYTEDNAGTMFRDGVPDTGRGRRIDESMPAVMRLAARLGGMPAMREPTAPELIHLLADHAIQDWRDVVDRTDVPFLMIAGRQSQIWPCEHAAAAVGRNALGRFAIIEDAGHAVNFDQPDRVNEQLLGFFAELV
jgi:non-heme chloroperoxidase